MSAPPNPPRTALERLVDLGAGLTSGATIALIAQAFEDPYKSVIQGVAALVGPLVMGAWPVVRRSAGRLYRIRQSRKAIQELRKIMKESEESKASEVHLQELRERLERAELYAADLQLERIGEADET